jgi:ribonuclease HI
MKTINIYTDGSYSALKNIGKWAFIAIENDKIIFQDSGLITDKLILTGFQVGAECEAVTQALTWAKNNGYKANIYFDFQNLRFWIADLFGEKPWKTNKPYTAEYRKKVLELREHLDSMVKVKSHSGVLHNELVDQLAKIN